MESSPPSKFYVERDVDRPIDILVLGMQNEKRSRVYSNLIFLSMKNDLTIKFLMNFDKFLTENERKLISEAKVCADCPPIALCIVISILSLQCKCGVQVVINLLGDKDDSKGTIPPSHLFKIRQLLAMGKVIVSEVC